MVWFLKTTGLVVVPIVTSFYITIIISRIITTTDGSGLECISTHSIASFYSLGVEIVVPSVRKVLIIVVRELLLKR